MSSPSDWESFLEHYYQEEILKLARNYPEERSLLIDYQDIERYNMELAHELLEKPDTVLAHAQKALAEIDLPIDPSPSSSKPWHEVHLRVKNLPEKIDIRELRSNHISHLIAIEGLVRKATEVRPKITNAAFQCMRCDHITYIPQRNGKFEEPLECENEECRRRGPFKLLQTESRFVDAQKIRLQESPENLRGGEQPQVLDINIDDDLAGMVAPGDRIIVNGILRSHQRVTQQGKSTYFDLVLDGVSIEVQDKEFEDVDITPEDEKQILKLSQDPQIYDKIVKSIAPSIFGYNEVKEAMALQLFSGVSKNLPDGSRIRGDIHVLLVGDPGVAKSQLLRYIVKLAPRGVYTSGKSSTSAGLTATAVKDEFGDGRWTLEAGALVLADKGIVCVDELDKMSEGDRSALHEGMEQQSYHPSTEILLANGNKIKIGEYIDQLMEKHQDQIIKGVDCEILPFNEIELLSTDFKKIIRTPVNRVSRHLAPDTFVKIRFSNGRHIIVTPEHPVYIYRNEVEASLPYPESQIIQCIPASQVKPGDFVPVLHHSLQKERVTEVSFVKNEGEYACKWVYDVTVEPYHNFISHGLVLHNTISVAKAGIMATLKSRCALLGAANPKLGRFDRYEGIAQQINMPPALISRFDLIFILTDIPEVKRDTSIARHILTSHYAGELSEKYKHVRDSGIKSEEVERAMEAIQPVITPDLLRKYVAYSRRKIFPVLEEEARQHLIDFYLDLRRQGDDPNAPIPVTARQLEALVRLSEACARARLSERITVEDTRRVIRIVEASLGQVMRDPETGKLDADLISTGITKSQRDKIKILKDIIRNLEDVHENGAPLDKVLEEAEAAGISRERVEEALEKLKKVGEIMEPRTGKFRLVNR